MIFFLILNFCYYLIVGDINYIQESAVYLVSETHGGEDVAVYARGPMSYLFDGYLLIKFQLILKNLLFYLNL